MSQKKYKKRKLSVTVTAKRQAEQERIADEKDRARKRMDPTARTLLLGDLVFLAAISLLDANGMVSGPVNAISTIIGIVLLVAALWFQFRKKDQWGRSGPKL